MNQNTETPKHSNRPFYILLLITGLPFMAALYLFYNPGLLEGFKTKNRGTLLQPSREVPALQLQTLDGKGLNTGELQGNWSLLTVAGSNCDEGCLRTLYYLRQTRLAMGEGRKRVQRILLLEDSASLAELPAKLVDFKGTRVVTGPAEARDRLLELLKVDKNSPRGRVYTIDPQGKIILTYASGSDPKDLIKDLEHLLMVVQL